MYVMHCIYWLHFTFICIFVCLCICIFQETSMNILPELADGLNVLLDSLVKSSFVIEKQPPQVWRLWLMANPLGLRIYQPFFSCRWQCKIFAGGVNFSRKNIFSRKSGTQISGSLIKLYFFFSKIVKFSLILTKTPKLLISNAFTSLCCAWTMFSNYALLQCKIFSVKIRECKIFDKYHIWKNLIKSTLDVTVEDEHSDECKIVRSTMMNYDFEYCRCWRQTLGSAPQ